MASLILITVIYYDSTHTIAVASYEIEPSLEYRPSMSEQEPTPEDAQPIEILDIQDIKPGTKGGQCVSFIQKYLNTYYTFPGFRGHARDIQPNSYTPSIGAAVLTHEGEYHTALIIALDGDDMYLAESNYHGDEIISVGRKLSVKSQKIRGYYTFSH